MDGLPFSLELKASASPLTATGVEAREVHVGAEAAVADERVAAGFAAPLRGRLFEFAGSQVGSPSVETLP